jgi:hypothetical protein
MHDFSGYKIKSQKQVTGQLLSKNLSNTKNSVIIMYQGLPC